MFKKFLKETKGYECMHAYGTRHTIGRQDYVSQKNDTNSSFIKWMTRMQYIHTYMTGSAYV